MTWKNGGPGNPIPTHVKRRVWVRQHGRCATYHPPVCSGWIEEYDHIVSLKAQHIERDDPRAKDPANIQGICSACHKIKTQDEARAATHARTKRTPLPNPGLVG